MKILVLDIVIVTERSIPIDFQYVQVVLKFCLTNEKSLELLTIHLEEIFSIVIFVDPTQEIDSILETIFFHIGLLQDHVPDLRLHL